nr:uncharacterized protein CI109_006107 [Kwoniella shandongensis]KAA5525534.1 hypothetical protein CI109_006107 [Kwoniella shandongensis]
MGGTTGFANTDVWGDGAVNALWALTGQIAVRTPSITSAVQQKRPIIITTTADGVKFGDQTLSGNHNYAVLNMTVNTSEENQSIFQLGDPCGIDVWWAYADFMDGVDSISFLLTPLNSTGMGGSLAAGTVLVEPDV